MEPFTGDPGFYVPFGVTAQNVNHVHTYGHVDANGKDNYVYPMPSLRDVAKVYEDYYASQQIGTDPGNNYTGTINSLGYFQMRYTGQSNNLTWDQLKEKMALIETEENLYKLKTLAINPEKGQIEAFLLFMQDTLKITDIVLYKVDDSGAKKLELDANNQVKENPCN